MTVKQFVQGFLNDEEGAVTIEYALVAAIIAVGLIAVLNSYETKVRDVLAAISTQMGSVKDAVVAVLPVGF